MKELKNTVFALVVAVFALLVLILLGIFAINKLFEGKPHETQINSRIIIEKITDQYFVVTKTVYLDEDTSINVDQGSTWSNFFWGQKLEAEGVVRMDIGVDLKGISEEDVEIDHVNKVIKIFVPNASVLDANVEGDIEVKSSKGLFRKLFKNNPNADYNTAMQKLIEEAKASVTADSEIMNDARTSSIKILELILKDTDYNIEIKDKTEKK